jgi:hypothetical protein
MFGDADDMARRMRLVLPRNWFGGATPVLDAALTGLGTAMASVYTLIQAVVQQSRLITATGSFIDSFAADFFGTDLLRWTGESDDAYRMRVEQALLCSRATRAAIGLALTELTGRVPAFFEPACTSDTGGYTIGGCGYCVAGGLGNLNLPYQFFLTIYRPHEAGIADLAGYGTGGIPVYGGLAMEKDGPTDADLWAAVPPLLPASTIAWCRISS